MPELRVEPHEDVRGVVGEGLEFPILGDQGRLPPLPLGEVIEVAHDPEPPVGERHPLDLPVVRLDLLGVEAVLDGAGGVVGLAGGQGVSEPPDHFRGERLRPEDPQNLGEVAAR